ncbi:MAG: alpha-glucosidase, partial [Firmicutes bacterium]|nr:alpha-glucosidase [Bacillota bacterium]
AGMPVCGVWCQDWQGARLTAVGSQLMWNWAWDPGRYPGLDEAIPRWEARGVRFLGYINPFLAVEGALYAYAGPRGYCVKDRGGKDYLVKSTTFSSAMVDFTNPEAYEWLKGVIKRNMIGLGLAGWMADFGEYLPTDCVLYEGDPARLHNRWPAIWARLNREAIEECGKLGEVFFFTRAGYTGSVKYSTLMWNGDQYTDWSRRGGMAEALPAALSLGVSGCGLSHSDAGGFSTFLHVRRSPELMARWAEFCAFTPLMRSHEGIRPGNNAQFDANEELLARYAKMARVHRGLKFYLRAAERENTERGVPVIRPLFFYYDGARDRTECYEYLLGRDILVAPVLLPGAAQWEVYLPEEEWVHLWSGKEYAGGVHKVPAPVGEPPVFVRKASARFNELMKLGGSSAAPRNPSSVTPGVTAPPTGRSLGD